MAGWAIRIAAACAALLVAAAMMSPRARQHTLYRDAPRPLVIAHQGGDGLWPSNTLYAFERADAMGVDVLEMDAHMTKDRFIVLSHDETVDRLTDGTGPIREMTLAEVQSLDAAYDWSPNDDGVSHPLRGQGITVPTLESVLVRFPSRRLYIEIKQATPPMVTQLCGLLREHGAAERSMVASFDETVTQDFREACTETATAAAPSEVRLLYYLHVASLGRLLAPSFESVDVPIEDGGTTILTERFIDAAHERGLWVDAWTIDDPEEMRTLVDRGIDGIITDRPDLLLEVLGR